ncbi:MAG: topoisomerase C-terminal repeat-containing protein, partial [Verrucomicrobiota bacterium]
TFKAYECENPECKLIVWKNMSGRELEREEVAALLTEKKIGPIEGFRSKMGRAFSAVVILDETTEWKQKFDFDKNENGDANGAVDLTTATSLGETPAGTVYELENAFLCVPAGGGKQIRMGKSICQRTIPADQALKIFREGKSDLLPRFISKKGKPFKAYLVLGEGKIGFEFEPRQPKPKKEKKA